MARLSGKVAGPGLSSSGQAFGKDSGTVPHPERGAADQYDPVRTGDRTFSEFLKG